MKNYTEITNLTSVESGESFEVTVEVTQEDIDKGEALDCYKCPIALALLRLFPDYVPDVEGEKASLCQEPFGMLETVFRASLPEDASDFVYTVDDGEPVEPIEFTLVFTHVG